MKTREICSVTIMVPLSMTAMLVWKLEMRQLRWAVAGNEVTSSRRKRAHAMVRPSEVEIVRMA